MFFTTFIVSIKCRCFQGRINVIVIGFYIVHKVLINWTLEYVYYKIILKAKVGLGRMSSMISKLLLLIVADFNPKQNSF
jgi:hypothetical protein